jgi:TusA-related sulfurtransferase
MKIGEVLEVIADCPQSFRNVPEEAVRHGYELAADPHKDGQDLYFYIKVVKIEQY